MRLAGFTPSHMAGSASLACMTAGVGRPEWCMVTGRQVGACESRPGEPKVSRVEGAAVGIAGQRTDKAASYWMQVLANTGLSEGIPSAMEKGLGETK